MPIYHYYCPCRPPAMGAIPKCFINFEAADARRFFSQIQREAWGYVEYDRELTEREVTEYELIGAEMREV